MRRVLRALLTSRGYVTFEAGTGEEVLQAASGVQPDVILLDLGLPDLDGIEVIRRLRQSLQTPIIILSVRAGESDKIAALEAGADDYLTKPYHPTDLCEHLRDALLRSSSLNEPVWKSGNLKVDLERASVEVNDKAIHLTAGEFDLLRALVLNAGRLLTQRRLAREAWGGKDDQESLQLLRTTIGSLRGKLESDPARPHHIVTEPGVGYRLRAAA